MTATIMIILAFFAGGLLGVFYFGTLWMTVQRLPQAKRPGLVTVVSFILRVGVTVAAFIFVMGGHWERLLSCLAGFIVARTALVRRWRPAPYDRIEEQE